MLWGCSMWWNIAFFAVSLALSYLLTPTPRQPNRRSPKPKGINDINFPTAQEGRDIPVLFGRRWISGPNVVWYGDLKTVPVKEKVKSSSGKK